jgi:hypothetical protein
MTEENCVLVGYMRVSKADGSHGGDDLATADEEPGTMTPPSPIMVSSFELSPGRS